MLKLQRGFWNLLPVNSPQLSWTQHMGLGCPANHVFWNFCCACSAVLFSMQINLTKLVTEFMQVSALNSISIPWISIFQDPIKSMWTSSHGARRPSLGRRCLQDFPASSKHWQISHLKLSINLFGCGWQNIPQRVSWSVVRPAWPSSSWNHLVVSSRRAVRRHIFQLLGFSFGSDWQQITFCSSIILQMKCWGLVSNNWRSSWSTFWFSWMHVVFNGLDSFGFEETVQKVIIIPDWSCMRFCFWFFFNWSWIGNENVFWWKSWKGISKDIVVAFHTFVGSCKFSSRNNCHHSTCCEF